MTRRLFCSGGHRLHFHRGATAVIRSGFSIVDLQTELNLARILRGIDRASVCIHCASGGPRIQRTSCRRVEVRMVEDVKEFRAELNLAAFAKESGPKVLDERHVEISYARAVDRVSTSVAECVERWQHKSIRVKPLFRISVPTGPVRIGDRVRALPGSADIRLVIRNEGRDRLTRL